MVIRQESSGLISVIITQSFFIEKNADKVMHTNIETIYTFVKKTN